MPDQSGMLERISREGTDYVLAFQDQRHVLAGVSLYVTSNPVRGPTARGNVYVEGTRSYRISAKVDQGVAPALSGTMLGPSAEFGGLLIEARLGQETVKMLCALLSVSRTRDGTVLNAAVMDVV